MKKDLTPRVFPLLVSAPSSCRTGYSNSCHPDVELGLRMFTRIVQVFRFHFNPQSGSTLFFMIDCSCSIIPLPISIRSEREFCLEGGGLQGVVLLFQISM